MIERQEVVGKDCLGFSKWRLSTALDKTETEMSMGPFSWLQSFSVFVNRTLVESQMELWEANKKPSEELAFLASLIALPGLCRSQPTCYGVCYELGTQLPPKKMVDS